ncbi:MAG TPA: aminotransferase class V-fold PLP-dependent enzyme [Candidatus Paceibacterota bacterium]|nr:aminotransferase class V-fold PLP-dependent enzyme [Candidatus Paceibacterota bacterium]
MGHFFPKKSRAYLDWASAAPVHPKAQKAFGDALGVFGNPSSPHEEGRAAKTLLEDSRMRIARLAGVKQRAVIFTSGATEANALAIRGRIERCRKNGMTYGNMHLLYLPTMHASVLGTVHELASLGVQVEPIALSGSAIDTERFATQLRPETVLVCVDAVCGETGARFDTLRLRRAIDAAHNGSAVTHAVLHVDASQLPLVEPIDYTRLGADLISLDAQKVGGVRGIGALLVPNARHITAITQGGGQEEGLRPGTEPVALAAAFANALEECAKGCGTFAEGAREARADLIARVTTTTPSALLNEGSRQAPHILNLSFPGLDTDYAVALLDTAGFAVSTRSACETDSEDGSKAVVAYTGDEARAKATLRISWGPETARKDLVRFAAALSEVTSFLEAD